MFLLNYRDHQTSRYTFDTLFNYGIYLSLIILFFLGFVSVIIASLIGLGLTAKVYVDEVKGSDLKAISKPERDDAIEDEHYTIFAWLIIAFFFILIFYTIPFPD